MPQINRIRVNNVKYNFGTQIYDDFMMNFNCKNTIYDLANGGGKSLLMLLLLQNVIPNCTLDDKQPIEKLFRADSQNTVIHSLVEWKLDDCYQKDNYKYMTTGFCARKARSGEESAQEGEENNNGQGDTKDNSKENASIEYFNYCIFYRKFCDNDIKNLPLTNNGEKITYNGLKTYLRNLEKNDFNVSVKIFDRKGDYQNFISKFGLFESQWEIIRGINKTEGHVRTYFETNYKTSRKVLEDLLIEEIIQKSYNNRLAVDNDEGKMAQTLLDIKDKLAELSRKHSQMSAYDSQISAMDDFAEYVSTYEDMFAKKKALENKLFNLLIAGRKEVIRKEREQEKLETEIEQIGHDIAGEQKNIQTAQVIGERNSLASIKELIDAGVKEKASEEEKYNSLKDKLTLMESVNDYRDYVQYAKQLDEITKAIDNRMRDHEDLVKELKAIASLYFECNKDSTNRLEKKCVQLESELKSLESDLESKKQNSRECEKETAVKESLICYTKQSIEEKESKISKYLEQSGLLLAEKASEQIDIVEGEIASKRKALEYKKALNEKNIHNAEQYNADIARSEAMIQLLEDSLKQLEAQKAAKDSDNDKLEGLKEVYLQQDAVQLRETVLSTFRSMDYEKRALQKEFAQLNEFISNAKSGTYICNDPLRDRLKSYLTAQYGDDVVEGHEWFRNLNAGQKRDVLNRAPFVEYSFIIKNDFERIRHDKTLENFEHGAYAIPVVSEQILLDTKLEVNKDLVVFAMKNMDFLRDDVRLENEIKSASEEAANLQEKIDKLDDRCSVVWDDYTFIAQAVSKDNIRISEQYEEIQKKLKENDILKQEGRDKLNEARSAAAQSSADIDNLSKDIEKDTQRLAFLKEISKLHQEISKLYKEFETYKNDAKDGALKALKAQEDLSKAEAAYKTAGMVLEVKRKELDDRMGKWNEVYNPYYREGYIEELEKDNSFNIEILNELKSLDGDMLESRFNGLKAALDMQTSDVSDKEALVKHYSASIKKCKNAIEYRGNSFEEVKNAYESGTLGECTRNELVSLKNELESVRKVITARQEELDAQNALMNRLEGSITHGIGQIEEKYGTFEAFECDNPESYIKQHKEQVSSLKSELSDKNGQLKLIEKEARKAEVIKKDLERIVENAGMKIPENIMTDDVFIADNEEGADNSISEYENAQENVDIADYENVQKEYESLTKMEYKKLDEFEKHKQTLMDLLNGFNAQELSQEIKVSVRMPQDIEQTKQLVNNLKETNTFIQLEKERVSKGIDEMERIRDNFENRCIQTCSNIKTELDRLSKLSTINMDNETISIVGLYIPYVKEEQYKDRMEAYIDETVVMAESFDNAADRLRYIRSRLSWKRLFSVIVKDMNAVRVNLYKRERIKDQSRYLRYEEAVGSTGQSQGIYIQFLIAIINYISSINAKAGENALIGKTIFIDNPFGAAKDIYIWEPIFKLLKTNHVQLIVPARGATPAITGRFDVNYILGQKLNDGRFQTVVVDYYSNVKDTEIEYTKMEYEQVSFDF